LCVALAGVDVAFAQIPGGLPGAVEPGRDRPPLMTPAQPNFDFSIEAPSRSPVPRAVDEIRFHLGEIQVMGAVTLSPDRFRPLYQALIGKDVSLSDILDVADAIEAEYRRSGYLLVRAFVPPQRVAGGIFTINVVEGFVANVSVEGGDAATQERIRAFLQPVLASKPLQLAAMEQALLLANDLPGVTASGLLRPSADTPGASDLVVTVAQIPATGGIAIDNRGSHFSGIWSVTGDFALNSLLDDGDQLAGNIITAPTPHAFERVAGQLRYRHPVGQRGAVLSLIGTVTRGEPGSTLRSFNVLTNSWAVGPRLTFPLFRTRAESLVFEGGITVQDAHVSILQAQFSHDEWRVADMGFSYLRNGFLGSAWAANVDLAQGLPILGATDNGSPELSRAGALTDFTKVTGGLSVTRPIVGRLSLALSAQGQYAFNPLVTGEQFVFGGTQIGRGYDPGALTGDHGLGGSVELRYDGRVSQSFIQALQPYAFFDAARVWDVQNVATAAQSIDSVGGGLRFWFVYNIFGAIEIARTLQAVPGSDGGKRTTKLLIDLAIRF
jgi:hemolysin activation/secretion protein